MAARRPVGELALVADELGGLEVTPHSARLGTVWNIFGLFSFRGIMGEGFASRRYERASERRVSLSVLDFQLSHRQRFTVFPRQSYLFGNVSTRSIHSRNLGLKNAFLSFQFFSSDSVKIEIF